MNGMICGSPDDLPEPPLPPLEPVVVPVVGELMVVPVVGTPIVGEDPVMKYEHKLNKIQY